MEGKRKKYRLVMAEGSFLILLVKERETNISIKRARITATGKSSSTKTTLIYQSEMVGQKNSLL